MSSFGPLEGIKVVDFSRQLAGPYCAMMLGDMGADVIKIEEPAQGDESRTYLPMWGDESSYFISANRNKRSLTLNLKSKEGLAIARKLAEDADILIENFRTGTMKKFGLDFETLSKINPRLVYMTISGFGRTGPLKDKPGYDLLVQAYGGIMGLTGNEGDEPVRVGASVADIACGMFAYSSVLTALYNREKTGKGQLVESTLLEGQVAWLTYHATAYFATGELPKRMGSGHFSIVPYQAFESSNGWIVVGTPNNRLFGRLCQALGQPELAGDPRFESNETRVAHREALVGILNKAFKQKTTDEWVEIIESYSIPCSPINTVDRIVTDPQVLARNNIVTLMHSTLGEIKVTGNPLKLTDTPGTMRLAPPLLGEHSTDVLVELGYSRQQIVALKEKGVV